MTMARGSGMPKVGAAVLTVDGDRLGTVKEVSESCFKVDAPMGPDYWLGTDTLASPAGTEVRLKLTKEQFGEATDEGRRAHQGMHRHDTTLI